MLLGTLLRVTQFICAFPFQRYILVSKAIQRGINIKAFSATLVHTSAATTSDIYTHITDDMQRQATANIDDGSVSKASPPKGSSGPDQESAPAQSEKPSMTDF